MSSSAIYQHQPSDTIRIYVVETTPILYSTPIDEPLCPVAIRVMAVASAAFLITGGLLIGLSGGYGNGFGYAITVVGVLGGLFTGAVFLKQAERVGGCYNARCC